MRVNADTFTTSAPLGGPRLWHPHTVYFLKIEKEKIERKKKIVIRGILGFCCDLLFIKMKKIWNL